MNNTVRQYLWRYIVIMMYIIGINKDLLLPLHHLNFELSRLLYGVINKIDWK